MRFKLLYLAVWYYLGLYLCASLAGQLLQDEALGYLKGGTVYPQDRVLGTMYIPETASKNSRQIFELVRSFWNQINAGALDVALLSSDGKKQVQEQVALFMQETPLLYRESLREISAESSAEVPEAEADKIASPNKAQINESQSNSQAEEATEQQPQNLPPKDYLQLNRVRLGNPVIGNDYARVRCRLEIHLNAEAKNENNTAFIQAKMYLLQENKTWKVDALEVNWKSIEPAAMNVFGRKHELYLP